MRSPRPIVVISASFQDFYVKDLEKALRFSDRHNRLYTCIVIACPFACSTGQKAAINDQLGAGDKGRFI